ncbi:MAG: IS200/IS605 family transposase [Chitinophagales bacterium]|nr:IS200/IS605 family transposase [Chitinophagales bacterium]
MSYYKIYYHIIFGTKHRKMTISEENSQALYKYIHGIIKNKKCKLYRINGIENHIHILTDLHPTIALSDFVKDIKVASSVWMKSTNLFPDFEGWQEGYGAFTYSSNEKDKIINYIKNQKEHHQTKTFIEEYKQLLIENNIDFDEKYLL